MTDTLWTPEVEALTRELWGQGLSCADIATQLNKAGFGPFTKNAVSGKVHRMGLPIRTKPRKPIAADVVVNGRGCQWPEGDPGHPDFHFCGATAQAGKPYCPEHHARAYAGRPEVKVRI